MTRRERDATVDDEEAVGISEDELFVWHCEVCDAFGTVADPAHAPLAEAVHRRVHAEEDQR